MGVVFLAEDVRLKRKVALKAMLPAQAAGAGAGKRFLREAESMAAVKHDHVVTIYQVDEDRGVPFLAMEFLQGEPLDRRLGRDKTLPLSEVLRIGREVAQGLDAAHKQGLIHRDIKPANLWLEGEPGASATGVEKSATEGRVKILDFGLARAASQGAGLTQQGMVVGTPAYMSPEQARGETVDARCDLFSLGCVLYRLSTGKLPFYANDAASTLVAVLTTQPEAPLRLNPTLPPEFSALVMRLLEKDPARRFGSASEVIQALRELEQPQDPLRTPAESTTSLESPSRASAPASRRLAWLIGTAVLVLGVVGVGLWASGLIRFTTDQGDLVLDCDDTDFAFVPVKGGLTLEDRKNRRTYTVKAVPQGKDEFELEVTEPAAELTFKTRTLTVKRGERVALKAWFERKEAVVKPVSEEAWRKQVEALPAEKQVEEVVARLKERNPGFDGKVGHIIRDDRVILMDFCVGCVTDIAPLRALTDLEILGCRGDSGVKGRLADLTPLAGMKLRELTLYYTRVADLTPLRGMPLEYLNCGLTRVADLSPVKGMPLHTLCFHDTSVVDLALLKDLPPLTNVNCANTRVSDLTPLRGLKLTVLNVRNTKVKDLTPLQGMPLKEFDCDFKPERDATILRSIKTLEKINGLPAAEFWKTAPPAPKP
jgi:hypothetical protein